MARAAVTLLLVGVLLACTAATTLASEEKTTVGPGFVLEESAADVAIADVEALDEDETKDGLELDEDDNEDDDDDSIIGQTNDADLEEAARLDADVNAQDVCDAKTACMNRHHEHVKRLTEEHEASVKKCEEKRKAKQASWVKFMNHCQAQAKKHCENKEKRCMEQKHIGKAGNVTVTQCSICKAQSKCVMTMKLPKCATVFTLPKAQCDNMCEALCPAQKQCEAANVQAEEDYKKALTAAQHAEKQCEDRNTNAAAQAKKFVDECQARNKKLVAQCEENAHRMADIALEKKPAHDDDDHDDGLGHDDDDELPSLKCPTLPCDPPKSTPLKCSQPLPKPPRRRHCAQTCTTKDCPNRSHCERSNNSLLRHIAKEEHKFQMCSIGNQKRRINMKHLQDACVRERVFHIAKCQAKHSEAVLHHHEQLMDCIRTSEVDKWDSCRTKPFKAPVCPVFVCKHVARESHLKGSLSKCSFKRVQNLKQHHFSRRTLRPCKKMCANAYFSKWRGLAVVKKRIVTWRHSKAYSALTRYKKNRFLCKRQACAKNAFRTFRRLLVPCRLGPQGGFCRKMRHYLAVRTLKKGYIVKRTERKLKACKAGEQGRSCRRVVGRWMRVQLRKCPAGKFQVRCIRVQRARERRKLRSCAKASKSIKYGWECRRLRSRCIKMFTQAKWCQKSRSKKACMDRAYANVRGKCYI